MKRNRREAVTLGVFLEVESMAVILKFNLRLSALGNRVGNGAIS